MPEPSFDARLEASGLRIPEHERANLAAFVADLDRAAAFVRSVRRGYSEEPATVFRLEPTAAR